MESQAPKPRILAFEITRRCRYKCLHCRAGADVKAADELTAEQKKHILRSVAKYSKCVIILTGGEPMECPEFYDLAVYGRQLGLRMVMATCGYPIDEKSVQKIKAAGILAVSLSIDGAEAKVHDSLRGVSGAYDSVVRAANICRQAGLAFQINTTITKGNIDQVEIIAALSEKLGAKCFNPFILVPTGRGKAMANDVLEADEYERLLERLLTIKQNAGIEVRVTCGPQFARVTRQSGAEAAKGCLGADEFGFISHRGDVQMCGFLDISAGNLVENDFDFAGIWEKSEFFNRIRGLSSYGGRCGRCGYVKSCGGCRARAFGITGDYMAEDPICSYRPGG